MQKLIVSIMLAALFGLGLVGIGSTEARAAANCPYTGCIGTDARINGPAQHKSGRVTFRIRVVAKSGTAKPKGQIVVSCHRPGKTKVKVRDYNRHQRFVSFHLGKKGFWSCKARFTSNGKFKSSQDRTRVRII